MSAPRPRVLGDTGLSACPVGFGAFKIGRNEKIKYAEAYALPSEDGAERLLNGVLDLGIDLIDTAPAYGLSEQRIGRHLTHRRGEFLLSTKVGETFENGVSTYDFSAHAVRHSVRRSLERLRTDVLDFVFLHSDGRDLHVLHETDAVETLLDKKRRGLVRFVGLSGKTVEGARAALEWADALMVEYHPRDTSHEGVIIEAAERGVAIFVKKPLASGTIAPGEALPFVLGNPGVSSVIIGGLNLDHLKASLEIACGQR
jgi:aryl-alcohol dehydrogenase-like predicted oxidoreductase